MCARYSPDANTQVINPPTLANSHWTHEDFKHKQCLNQKEVSPITKQLKNKMHLIYGTPPGLSFDINITLSSVNMQ